jgi:hypothetical protein
MSKTQQPAHPSSAADAATNAANSAADRAARAPAQQPLWGGGRQGVAGMAPGGSQAGPGSALDAMAAQEAANRARWEIEEEKRRFEEQMEQRERQMILKKTMGTQSPSAAALLKAAQAMQAMQAAAAPTKAAPKPPEPEPAVSPSISKDSPTPPPAEIERQTRRIEAMVRAASSMGRGRGNADGGFLAAFRLIASALRAGRFCRPAMAAAIASPLSLTRVEEDVAARVPYALRLISWDAGGSSQNREAREAQMALLSEVAGERLGEPMRVAAGPAGAGAAEEPWPASEWVSPIQALIESQHFDQALEWVQASPALRRAGLWGDLALAAVAGTSVGFSLPSGVTGLLREQEAAEIESCAQNAGPEAQEGGKAGQSPGELVPVSDMLRRATPTLKERWAHAGGTENRAEPLWIEQCAEGLFALRDKGALEADEAWAWACSRLSCPPTDSDARQMPLAALLVEMMDPRNVSWGSGGGVSGDSLWGWFESARSFCPATRPEGCELSLMEMGIDVAARHEWAIRKLNDWIDAMPAHRVDPSWERWAKMLWPETEPDEGSPKNKGPEADREGFFLRLAARQGQGARAERDAEPLEEQARRGARPSKRL